MSTRHLTVTFAETSVDDEGRIVCHYGELGLSEAEYEEWAQDPNSYAWKFCDATAAGDELNQWEPLIKVRLS